MDSKYIEHHKKTMHKVYEYVKRHENDFLNAYEARYILLESMKCAVDEYKKKVLLEQALDYVSK